MQIIEKIKNYFKKNWIDAILLIIGCVLLFFVNSDKNRINVFENLPKDAVMSSFVVPVFLGLMAICITITILFYQLYFNRYNLRNFSSEIFPVFLSLGIHICLGLMTFCVYYYTDMIHIKIFCYYIFFAFVIRFLVFIASFKILTLSFFIQNLGKVKKKALNKADCSYSEIKEIFDDLSEYLNESIEKKENHYIDIVMNVISEIYILYLNNSGKICSQIESEEKKQIETYFASQLAENFFKILNTKLMDIVIYNYISFLLNYSQLCLKTEKNFFIEKLFYSFSSHYVNNKITERDTTFLCKFSYRLYKYALSNNYESSVEVIENFFLDTMLFSNFFFEEESSRFDLFRYLSNMASLLVENTKYDKYKKLLTKLTYITNSDLNKIDHLSSKSFSLFLRWQYDLYCKTKEIRKDFEEFLSSVAKISIYVENVNLIKNIGLIYSDMQEQEFITKEVFEMNISLFNLCCNKVPDYAFFFSLSFNNLTKKIFNISEAIKIFDELICMAIRTKNKNLVDSVLDDFSKEIIQQPEIPEDFIRFFEKSFIYITNINDEDLLYLFMNEFLNSIKELHDKKKLTDSLMNAYFSVWETLCSIVCDTNQSYTQKYVLNKLTSSQEYIDDLLPSYKQQILEILLHTSISAIESNNQELLRICSNQIGWMIKDAIDNQDNSTYEEGVNTFEKLFNLASEVGMSDIFLSFESTIFILIGTLLFQRKDNDKLHFFYDTIKNLNYKGERNPILIGKHLREYEANCWRDFFDTEKEIETLINEFYKDFIEYINKNNCNI